MGALRLRLDDRLVHSEVLYGELEAAAYDLLIVAARAEALRRADVAMVPRPVAVARVAPEVLAQELVGRAEQGVLVVMETLADLMGAVGGGFRPASVILANRAKRAGSQPLSPTFYADGPELAALEALLGQGVVLLVQRVPGVPAETLDGVRLSALRAEMEAAGRGGGSSEPC